MQSKRNGVVVVVVKQKGRFGMQRRRGGSHDPLLRVRVRVHVHVYVDRDGSSCARV